MANFDSRWRAESHEVITVTLKACEGQTPDQLKKALYDAYPFGMRKYHPYKIWLSELAILTGKKKRYSPKGRPAGPTPKPDERQAGMFEGEI